MGFSSGGSRASGLLEYQRQEFVPQRTSVELILVLFPETVTGREKLPAALLVHLPHVGLLKDTEERTVTLRRLV